MPNVIVKIIPAINVRNADKRIRLIKGAKVISIQNGASNIKGNTNANGVLTFSLNPGIYRIAVESTTFLPPDTRNVVVEASVSNVEVRPFRVFVDGDDCAYIVRRIKMLVKKGEVEKARQLMEMIAETYSQYQDIPQLKGIVAIVNGMPPK